MQRLLIYIFAIGLLAIACKTEKATTTKYLRWVGDIAYNETKDDPEFKLCNTDNDIFQYHNVANGPQYEGEKITLIEAFHHQYEPVKIEGQSGMIRLRFIVNCEGETDRFRLISADENYQPFTFSAKITDQLMAITKSLKGWKPLDLDGQPLDYYQYLIFIMKDGEIVKIMP